MPMMVDLGRRIMEGKPDGVQFTGDANGARDVRRFDPATATPGASPNFGQFALPHVITFTGTVASMSNVYRPSDEALRDSRDNARYIRNDLVVMECVEARQRATALLNWHVEPPEEKDGSQKALAGTLTKMISSTPRFMQYRENLLHGVYFGRYAVGNRWRWKNVAGGRRIVVDRWRPVHGDKLVWRYEPDDHRWDEDQVGIRVGLAYGGSGNLVAGRWSIEKAAQVAATDQGLAYFLRPWERPLLSIHKHYIEDGEFETPEYAGRIHGVGIRSRIYWTWFQKQETLAWLMEYMERSAGGFDIWFYPWGNDQAKKAVEDAARNRMSLGRNQLLVPKFLEGDQMGNWYDRIEPGMAGADALKSIIIEFFGHLLKRYILGQTLTTESAGTGLGSNLADVHLATFLQIVKYDATNLEETLTTDLLDPMIRFNFPWAVGLPFRIRIDTESENSAEKLEAYKSAFEMGLKIRAQDVYDIIGASKPQPGDELLDKASQAPDPSSLGGLGALLGKSAEDQGAGDKGPSARPPSDAVPAGDDDPTAEQAEQFSAPQVERFSALWKEAEHPRDDVGRFEEKGGGSGSKRKLPGLPASAERKVDWSSTGGNLELGFAAAESRKGGQYKSREGQSSLFGEEDEQLDRQHAQILHDAVALKEIDEEQAQVAAEWVRQHGAYPRWYVLAGRSFLGTDLVGRVDRGEEAFAVHVEPDGNVSVYPWPGYGKHKKKRFSSSPMPLEWRTKKDQPPDAAAA
jgi:hypothetical protein